MTTPQTMNDFIEWLKSIHEECRSYFPDNDSQQAGYQAAIEDILDHLEGPREEIAS